MKSPHFILITVFLASCVSGRSETIGMTETESVQQVTEDQEPSPTSLIITDDLKQLIPLFDEFPEEGRLEELKYSSSKRWVASTVSLFQDFNDRPYALHRLTLSDSFSEREYLVYEEVFLNCCLEGGFPQFVKWSGDETIAFFVERLPGDGCFAKAYRNLTSIRLFTGETQLLITSGFYDFAISPDDKYLAYFGWDSFAVNIISLNNNQEIVVNLENLKTDGSNPPLIWWPDNLVWSPNSSSLVFSVTRDACGDEQNEIVLLNIGESQVRVIHEFDDMYLRPIGWTDDGLIVRQGSEPFDYLLMNTKNGELHPLED
jgi:hypothetical protein